MFSVEQVFGQGAGMDLISIVGMWGDILDD